MQEAILNEVEPMDEDTLVSILQEQHREASGADNSEVAQQRSDAMDRYLGEPYTGNLAPVKGRSQVNSRDLTDVIEGAMPQIIDVFYGGDQVVELDPQSGEDTEAVKLASQWLNYVFLRENNGFMEGHQAIKDALIQKDGILKAWVEETVDSELTTYYDLIEEEVFALTQMGFEIVGYSQNEVGLFDVEVRENTAKRKIRVKAIPPEEFKVSKRTRSNLQESPYVCHEEEYTKGQLRELLAVLDSPHSIDEVWDQATDSNSLQSAPERNARHRGDSTNPNYMFNDDVRVVAEEYIFADVDGDGFDERIKVIRVGSKLLLVEPVNLVPFGHLTAILLSHKWNGLSFNDLINDIAETKTALKRNILDNVYQTNNSRWAVLDGQVNMDDLLVSRPGGVIREKVPGAVRPLQAPQLAPAAFEMLGYHDQIRDERTGISKMSQGLDPNALSSNVASGAINQVMTANQARMKLIARVLGEGFKQIFWVIHELSREYISGEQKFTLNGQQVTVDPSRFMKRSDLSIRVGLGNAEKDAQLQRMGMLAQDMQMIAANGGSGRILQEQNVYNLAVERARIAGEKNPERYYTDPQQLPPPQQQPSQAEIDMQLKQMDIDAKLAETQMKIESEERIEVAKLELKSQELQLKRLELAAEVHLEEQQQRGVELG